MKKLTAVFLVIVMFFTITVPVFAANGESDAAMEYDGNPVIVVRGFDFAGLTYANGDKAINLSAGSLFSIFMKTLTTPKDVEGKVTMADSVFLLINELFAPIASDHEGNPIEDVTMIQYYDSMANHLDFVDSVKDSGAVGVLKGAVDRYGAENTYFFVPDWRKAPILLAEDLNKLVESAKEASGKDQVNIICASMGCMVTTAYMHYYGTDSINSAVYLSGAHNGGYVCGDAFNGRLSVDKQVVIDVVESATGNNIYLKILLFVCDVMGGLDFLVDSVNYLLTNDFDRAMDLMFRDCFGTQCGLWALCPDEDIESGIETFFSGYEEEYPVLLEKLEEVKDFVFSTEEILMKAKTDGVKISFLSNYNVGLVPVYERSYLNGDMVLETELTSNFATVAPLGKTLSDKYLKNVDSKYISPDKVIDTSTTVFRNNTWFVKNASHVAGDYKTDYGRFVFILSECETQPTIDMFERYPQFMVADDFLTLSPLRG